MKRMILLSLTAVCSLSAEYSTQKAIELIASFGPMDRVDKDLAISKRDQLDELAAEISEQDKERIHLEWSQFSITRENIKQIRALNELIQPLLAKYEGLKSDEEKAELFKEIHSCVLGDPEASLTLLKTFFYGCADNNSQYFFLDMVMHEPNRYHMAALFMFHVWGNTPWFCGFKI